MAYTTIDNPELYFQCKIFTGTGSSLALTLDGDTDMQPDLVWVKARTSGVYTNNHGLFDAVRGVGKAVESNRNVAEQNAPEGVTAFGSDGFTLGTDGTWNESSLTAVAWCWKESATAGFDIVTYTGNGTDDTDISHNLSATPKMIMVKNRDAADDWQVYHGANTSSPETDYLVLNETDATADAADRWSDEAPTSSVFTLGDADEVNTDTEDYIAYCFAEKQGFSKFGSYAGNANANGVFIYTGFKPAFFICKRADATVVNSWNIFDNKRNTFNETNCFVEADTSDAEDCASGGIDFLSNGIKIRTASARFNQSSSTYIYIAFAEAPFVNSNGVPCNAR